MGGFFAQNTRRSPIRSKRLFQLLSVKPISRRMAEPWILKMHYAKRMPNVMHSYGLFDDRILTGVVTYGMPASPYLCKGICGEEYKDFVLELNRLVLYNNRRNEASYLIANSLQRLPRPRIVVSYADTEMGHVGYVYQATNWLYTGATKERTDIYSEAGHARHHDGDTTKRQPRSAKHRYVTFTGDRREKREMRKALRYDVLDYPKGDGQNYTVEYNMPRQGTFDV